MFLLSVQCDIFSAVFNRKKKDDTINPKLDVTYMYTTQAQ